MVMLTSFLASRMGEGDCSGSEEGFVHEGLAEKRLANFLVKEELNHVGRAHRLIHQGFLCNY